LRDRREALAEDADRAREQHVARAEEVGHGRFQAAGSRAAQEHLVDLRAEDRFERAGDAFQNLGGGGAAVVDHGARHRLQDGLRDGHRAGQEQQHLLHGIAFL